MADGMDTGDTQGCERVLGVTREVRLGTGQIVARTRHVVTSTHRMTRWTPHHLPSRRQMTGQTGCGSAGTCDARAGVADACVGIGE